MKSFFINLIDLKSTDALLPDSPSSLFIISVFLHSFSTFIPFHLLLVHVPLRNSGTVDNRAKLIWGDLGKCKGKVEKTSWEPIVQYMNPPPNSCRILLWFFHDTFKFDFQLFLAGDKKEMAYK